MALTANIKLLRRGPVRDDSFGYPIAPGEVIYAGGFFGVNAAGQAVRLQTSGLVAFVGIATNGVSNVGNAAAGPTVVGSTDSWGITVPAATMANINAKVYATDDGTPTLSVPGSGFAGVVGYLAGIDNGQTFVKVQGH